MRSTVCHCRYHTKCNHIIVQYGLFITLLVDYSTSSSIMASDDDFISNGIPSPDASEESKRPAKRSRVEAEERPAKAPVTKMEKSVFGLEPSDEFVKEIADWIWYKTRNCEHKVEVGGLSSHIAFTKA